jgi:ankyrin repeat protein
MNSAAPIHPATRTTAGADPTRVDVNGLGPLHCAAIYGDVESVRALVESIGKVVDVNQRINTVRGEMCGALPSLSANTP